MTVNFDITRYVNIKRFAELVNKPASTVRLMCRQLRIPGAVKLGNEWLIDPKQAKATQWNEVGRPRKDENNVSTRVVKSFVEPNRQRTSTSSNGRRTKNKRRGSQSTNGGRQPV